MFEKGWNIKRDIEFIRDDIKFEEKCIGIYRKELAAHRVDCNKENCQRCKALAKIIENAENRKEECEQELKKQLLG